MSASQPLHIRIATRGSDLALRQAVGVKEGLEHLGHSAELVAVEARGDSDLRPFRELSGQGFFTQAVQEALLEGRAELAVHSYKDLPSAATPGFEVAAVPTRADARDALVIRPEHFDLDAEQLPLRPGARVGTGAVRRSRQLQKLRGDLVIADMRGNVPTRIDRLRAGTVDAVVLAVAGLERLGLKLDDLEVVALHPQTFVPAPAQGALALEIRRHDYALAQALTDLHDPVGYRPVAAERGLMSMLRGGCQLALGAHATLRNGLVTLNAWYEGLSVVVEHPSSEGAALLAFEALGRPDPVTVVEGL
ncbi:MAG: hydroxymethylbilane synthase [Truepera sp.]|nr:hydroxymethylbilane synthase [Truepera sp.]